MGNKVTQSAFAAPFMEFEHKSGKRLIAAIRLNDEVATQQAIDAAKKEFSAPVSANANKADYQDMVDGMNNYLTKGYDIGDGPIFTKCPIEYARLLKADKSEAVLVRNLQELEGILTSKPKVSAAVGTVTHERAQVAKDRLKAFQETKKTKT